MIYLAIFRRAAPFLLLAALLGGGWAWLKHTERVYYAAGQANVQEIFDEYVKETEASAALSKATGEETTRILKLAATAAEGKLNATLARLRTANGVLAADNAGVRDQLAAQAAARPRPDSENTPATCRSDEERVRVYAGLLAEGDKLVEQSQAIIGACAAKLTALQEYAQSLKFVKEAE